jgi:hypothetical protein
MCLPFLRLGATPLSPPLSNKERERLRASSMEKNMISQPCFLPIAHGWVDPSMTWWLRDHLLLRELHSWLVQRYVISLVLVLKPPLHSSWLGGSFSTMTSQAHL